MLRRAFLQTLAGTASALFLAGARAGSALPQSTQAPQDFVDYSARDHEVVDYELYDLPDIHGLKFRGPRPLLTPGNYFSVIGGAQALGVLVPRPYPQLLSERLQLPVLNLGLGGGTAGSYLLRPALIDYINRGRFAVLQVMTARGEPNGRFERTDGVTMLRDRVRGDVVNNVESWERLFREERDRLPLYVAQSRNGWVASYLELIQKITVPILLFWFSPRPLDVSVDSGASSGAGYIGAFPQLVDRCSLESIRPLCRGYAECFSNRNFDYEFVDRFTGRKGVVLDYRKLGTGSTIIERRNTYYPSQEMHDDAVEPLLKGVSMLG